jgi:hypothetical protein
VAAPAVPETSNAGSYAWAENAGWINFAPNAGPGVTVTSSTLSGYAWSENFGWIALAPGRGGGVLNSGNGTLSGYAWGENAGWINFAPAFGGGVGIDGATGQFSGYAWGENVGWINFGIANPVVTSWRATSGSSRTGSSSAEAKALGPRLRGGDERCLARSGHAASCPAPCVSSSTFTVCTLRETSRHWSFLAQVRVAEIHLRRPRGIVALGHEPSVRIDIGAASNAGARSAAGLTSMCCSMSCLNAVSSSSIVSVVWRDLRHRRVQRLEAALAHAEADVARDLPDHGDERIGLRHRKRQRVGHDIGHLGGDLEQLPRLVLLDEVMSSAVPSRPCARRCRRAPRRRCRSTTSAR